jgi:hypothetical protein
MSTKRKLNPPGPVSSAVPEYVQQSRLLQRRKVTKRKLPTFAEAMLLLHAPEALRLYWEAMLEGLKARDKGALEAAGEIFNYVRGKGINLTVTQQLLNQNAVAGPNSPVVGFDAFARQLAEARAGHALPSPDVVDVLPENIRPADTAMEA